ncbi:MAG: hypothetical protein F4X95_00005 [Oligoflexia bacterium]|nr:hypothetical protein [Oligoflexia bacterium]
MEKYNVYVPILYSLLILLHIKIQAAPGNTGPLGPFAFSKEEEFLSLAEKAESLDRKIEEANLNSINAEMVRLRSDVDQHISKMFDEVNFSYKSLFRLKEEIESLEDALNREIESSNKTKVNGVNHTLFVGDLIRDPATAQVDTPYRIDWLHHPRPTYIVFGPKIIDVFFHPKKDMKTQFAIARKNLKALQVGYAGKYGDAGIKILTLSNPGSGSSNRNRIFEIKTVGKLSGHIRWGGFIAGDFLYIVHYANNTHNNRYKHAFMMNLLDKLQSFHSAVNE